MGACWPLQLPPVAKAVLISLADNANDHGACWPAIATICKRTCYGKTAVIDAIAGLELRGLLIADRTNGRHSRYTITVGQPDLFSSPNDPQPDRLAHRSARRSGPSDEPHRTATRTAPDRHADTNRKEPSLTVKSTPETKIGNIPQEEKPITDDVDWRATLPRAEQPRPARGAHRPAPRARVLTDAQRTENWKNHIGPVLAAAGIRRSST